MIVDIVFTLICVYLVWFVSYLFTVELGRHYFRAVNKVFLALIYLVLAFMAFFTSGADKSLSVVLLLALVFTCIGDIVLMFHFMIGAGLFTLGNILVFVYQLMIANNFGLTFADIWYFIIVALVVIGIGATYFKKSKKLDFKKKYPLTLGYLFFVTMHGALGAVLIFTLKMPFILPLCLGSMMFMSSDYLLTKYEFSINPKLRVQRLNSTCYFLGILLISLSLFMM